MSKKSDIKKYIAFVLLLILVIAGLTFIIKNNEKMEKRLKAKLLFKKRKLCNI